SGEGRLPAVPPSEWILVFRRHRSVLERLLRREPARPGTLRLQCRRPSDARGDRHQLHAGIRAEVPVREYRRAYQRVAERQATGRRGPLRLRGGAALRGLRARPPVLRILILEGVGRTLEGDAPLRATPRAQVGAKAVPDLRL